MEIKRRVEIDSVRKMLPIFFKENEIVEAINSNLVTVVSGETGCGKSTQIPQFLIEAGFSTNGVIAVPLTSEIYHIGNTTPKTSHNIFGQTSCRRVQLSIRRGGELLSQK